MRAARRILMGLASLGTVPTATVTLDNFNRADSLGVGTSSSGVAWTFGGWITISSNKAVPNNSGDALAAMPSGRTGSYVVEATVTLPAGSATGLAIRASDGSNYFFALIANDTFWRNGVANGGTVVLFKKASGSYTQVGTTARGSCSMADGSTHTVKVWVNVDTLVVYWDGVQVDSYNMSGADHASYQHLCGFRTTGSVFVTWDDLKVSA